MRACFVRIVICFYLKTISVNAYFCYCNKTNKIVPFFTCYAFARMNNDPSTDPVERADLQTTTKFLTISRQNAILNWRYRCLQFHNFNLFILFFSISFDAFICNSSSAISRVNKIWLREIALVFIFSRPICVAPNRTTGWAGLPDWKMAKVKLYMVEHSIDSARACVKNENRMRARERERETKGDAHYGPSIFK